VKIKKRNGKGSIIFDKGFINETYGKR